MLRIRALALMLVAALGISGSGATAAPFILVSNIQSGTVSVIDAESNTVATTVPVTGIPHDIAVTPDGSFAYVGGSVIDTAAGVVTDTIPTGYGIALTRDGALAYVSGGGLWVIDTASRTVVEGPISSGLYGVAIAPDDSLVYAVASDTLQVIDTSTNSVIDSVGIGGCSNGIALSPDGALAYVANQCGGTLSVVNTSSRMLIDMIPTGQGGSQAVAITRDGRLAYVSNTASNTVSVIDLTTRRVVGAPIAVGEAPFELAITPDERFVYVANQGGSVSVIERATNTVVATIPVQRHPGWLAIAPTFTIVPPPECADGLDNDGDEAFDWGVIALPPLPAPGYGDPGCDSPSDTSERSAALVCDDGIDNDGDGFTDYPTDPGCSSPSANIEDPMCDNGVDDDGDGRADFPADPACTSAFTESERAPWLACDDGYDNDFDGFTDYADLDCRSLMTGTEATDVDSDGVAPKDNCALVPNPSQLDSNLDGYGNACDADYDDDGIVTRRDRALLRLLLGSTIETSEYQGPLDYDGNGVINVADFQLLIAELGGPPYVASLDADGDGSIGKSDLKLVNSTFRDPPGPSGLACAGRTGSCYCQYYSCGF